jgi:4-amino-4-deoxychorismate lyase
MSESRNRGFLYGESVFTTMRMKEDHLSDWEAHFERLKLGAEFLYGPFKEEDWQIELKNRLETRCQSESGNKILRLALYTEQDRGLRGPVTLSIHDLKMNLSVSNVEDFPDRLINLRSCPAFLKPYWWPSFFKAGNYLETILSQKKYLQKGDDDLLFLSGTDQILESSIANIFVVKGNKLYTAPLGPNVLDGIARRKVLLAAQHVFEDVLEESSSLEQTYKAEGVFGSNSIRGLFLVGKIDDHDISLTEEFKVKFEALRSITGYEKN